MYLSDYGLDDMDMLRICSLQLRGNIKLRTYSRPLDQAIAPDFLFDLAMLDDLMNQIQVAANENQSSDGQIGCTTEDVYDIIANYVNEKVRKVLTSTVKDLAKAHIYPDSYESTTIRDTKKAFSTAFDTITSYTDKVVSKSEKEMKSKLENRLKDWGLNSEQVVGVLKEVAKAASDVISIKQESSDTEDDLIEEYEFQMEDWTQRQKEKIWQNIKAVSDDALARFLGYDPKKDTTTTK